MGGRWLRSAARAHRERSIDYKRLLEEQEHERILAKEDILFRVYARDEAIELLQSELLIGIANAQVKGPESGEAILAVSEGLLSVLINAPVKANRKITEADMMADPKKAAEYYQKMTGKSIVKDNEESE